MGNMSWLTSSISTIISLVFLLYCPPSIQSFISPLLIPTTTTTTTSLTTAKYCRPTSSRLHNNNNNNENANAISKGIRLNKCFKKTHSRREADRLIGEGRVSINNVQVTTKGGSFVQPYVDEIKLDNEIVVGWEEMNYITKTTANSNNSNEDNTPPRGGNAANNRVTTTIDSPSRSSQSEVEEQDQERQHKFEYIKYWKPCGIICTTDVNIQHNIITELRTVDGYNKLTRIYPVGRLDKETSGLILLTNDGRVPNSSLRQQYKRPKVYEVQLNAPLTTQAEIRNVVQTLSNGVVITTETVRDGGIRKRLTAATNPCHVEPIYNNKNERHDDNVEVWWLRIILQEGRNRQVRKMIHAIGYSVIELERVSFAGITLDGLNEPGDWKHLTTKEMSIIHNMIQIAAKLELEPLSESSTISHKESKPTLSSYNDDDDYDASDRFVKYADDYNADDWNYNDDNRKTKNNNNDSIVAGW